MPQCGVFADDLAELVPMASWSRWSSRPSAANPELRLPLTSALQQTASELVWYRQWLLEHGYTEDDLIPFVIA